MFTHIIKLFIVKTITLRLFSSLYDNILNVDGAATMLAKPGSDRSTSIKTTSILKVVYLSLDRPKEAFIKTFKTSFYIFIAIELQIICIFYV